MKQSKLTDTQIKSVYKLDNKARYRYTIKQIVEWGCLWSIIDKRNQLFSQDKDRDPFFQIWPAKEYVNNYISNDNFSPVKINLDFFIKKILPDIITRNQKLMFFSTPTDEGLIVECESFLNDLSEELDKY